MYRLIQIATIKKHFFLIQTNFYFYKINKTIHKYYILCNAKFLYNIILDNNRDIFKLWLY